MPKQHIYLPQKTLDKIKSMVDERLNNGATHADANISKLCVEMMNIGIRAFEYHQNNHNKNKNTDDKEKMMIASIIKTEMCMKKILEMQFSFNEIRADSRYNFTEMKDEIMNYTNNKIEEIYPKK
ncbi:MULTISPECIES: relaxosome protein TraM [unclassified Providencia]|uniref:relaxosome protein TraM n=1 Tax=unclassified Providencia TaxID=2633465 RepID=UPI00234A6C69|nr:MULTISPECIES: relaxosome protein TraM [unclassified Providencia]WOB97726.1 relaxosome protein TraM [Providencia sp. PROV099]